jgi:hypothetical protein
MAFKYKHASRIPGKIIKVKLIKKEDLLSDETLLIQQPVF